MQNPVHTRCVRRLYYHDGIKTLLALFGALAAALLFLPISHRLAMALVEITADKQTNALLSGLSNFCQTATLIDIFRINFFFFLAVACLLLFARLHKTLGLIQIHERPWNLLIAAHHCGEQRHYELRKNPLAVYHCAVGFLLAFVLVFLVLWYFFRGAIIDGVISASLLSVLIKIGWALFITAAIELIFRGVLLGVWLRNSSPFVAIIIVALIGAAGCFLQTPTNWVDPQDVNLASGVVMMKAMISHGLTENVWWGYFMPIVAVGIVLGLARYRSSSLWLPFGLHLGLRVGFNLCLLGSSTQLITLPVRSWQPMQVGISALIAAIVAGMMVISITRKKGRYE